jgi:translation initiation factor 2 subunit 1
VKQGLPEKDELVICKVKRVQNFGAFVDVIEYNNEGFIHISQVASTWIKNIRNHIHEGEIRVGKVTRIDQHKGLIDISLRRVTKDQERKTLDLWKRDKRADNLLSIAAKKLKVEPEKFVKEVKDEIGADDVFAVFEEAFSEGAKAFEGLPPKWVTELVSLAKENVKIPILEFRGNLKIEFVKPNGVELIRKAFDGIEKDAEINYISAPNYLIKVSGKDPKFLEKKLKKNVEQIKSNVLANDGVFEFKREK